MFKKVRLFQAIATLTGTTIGAGILGIPYIVQKAGFLTGLILIIVLGLTMLFLNLLLGEIVLRTNGNHQLAGYAEKYLGKIGKHLMSLSLILGIYGALLAYIIGEGETLATLFNSQNYLLFSIIFFLIASFIVHYGLKILERSELFLISILLFLISLIAIFSFTKIDLSNLNHFNPSLIFLPYGVIFFAFLGTAAIPEIKEELNNNRHQMKKALIIGTLIPLIVYIIFTLIVIGVTGTNVSEIATLSLGNYLGEKVFIFANLFAIVIMASAFISLSFALKEAYIHDYKLNKNKAFILTIIIPLILFLIGLRDFIKVLSITGALLGSLDGILIVLMSWKASKKGDRNPEYQIKNKLFIGLIVMLIFIVGLILTIKELF